MGRTTSCVKGRETAMPRDRKNPFKSVSYHFEPKETTVVLLTCIPTEEGYYANRFDVLKLCLASLMKHTGLPYDLLVFDNGSVPAVVDFLRGLHAEGKIHYLMLSRRNIGYGAALNMAFAAAPGKVIAYTDDDIFFYPDWLSEHLKVLETFPNVGVVSGQVVEGDGAISAVEKWIQNIPVSSELFPIPFEWTERWCRSLGLDPHGYTEKARERNFKTYLISYQGLRVFSGARGYAYTFKKELLKIFPPLETDRLVGGSDAYWHQEIDRLGYLRLSTYRRLTDHIGNVVDDFWKQEAEKYGIPVEESTNGRVAIKSSRSDGLHHRFLRRVMSECLKRL